MPLVHPTDSYSNKTMLPMPTPGEVAELAQLSRRIRPEATSKGKEAAPHRSIRRRLAPQAIEELVARYTAGETTPALSREYGISASGLRDLLRAEGVSLRGHAITVQDAERAVRLYERGLTITQVEKQVGYSYGTIRRVLRENGVVVRGTANGKRAASDK